MAYNNELDKITYAELSLSLQNTIKTNQAHTQDELVHVTQREKDNWNRVLDLPLANDTAKGFLAPEEKLKLAGIEPKANKYVHPKNGVVPGIYTQVEVDDEGHVKVGRNPSKINTTAENADRLGTYPASAYAKLVSPEFLGTPKVPTPEKTADATQIVNIEYVNSQMPYIKQATAPEETSKNKFWIGPNNCLNAFDSDNKWNSVFAEVGLFLKALNADETKPTKPNDYSNFFKFIGKRKVSALNLKTQFTAEYATVFGMRSDEDEYAYEFLMINGQIFMRIGKGDTWKQEVLLGGNPAE